MPGAGKTLVGLDVAIRQTYQGQTEPVKDEGAVYLSGNGRVGRLLLFKECLRNGIVPFILTEDLKLYYYRGIQNWETEPGYLRDTCGLAQDRFRQVLEYFRVKC